MQAALELLRAAGARPAHVQRVLRAWLAGRPVDAGLSTPARAFPRAALAALPEVAARLDALATPVSEHPGADGAVRCLLHLGDGATVESVRLARQALCISTQVGCAVRCAFCQTGREGLLRNLSTGELLAQVARARRAAPVRRVVLMGMGEPLHNLEAALEALTCLGGAGGFGHKELVFSTVGEPRAFERLRENPVKPALALSLHTTDARLRAELLPHAPRVDPRQLVDAACAYAAATGHPLQVQWTLLAGVNDGDDELHRLASWIAGRRVVVNYVPWNPVDGAGFERPTRARMYALTRGLHALGVVAKLRRTSGADVEGACGQLRARAV